MSDLVFTGADVDAVLKTAAEAVGREVSELRYVVLDPGSPGGRGLSPTPARVAVILEKARASGAVRKEPAEERDTRELVQEVVDQLIRVGGLALQAKVEVGDEALVVALSGEDREFFFGHDGEGEILRSLEYLLGGMFGRAYPSRRIVVHCEGFRERREEALRQTAVRLAEAVLSDGVARTTAPMNSYERRLVHVAVSSVDGVVTYSVGEGADRRVTVAVSGQNPGGAVPAETLS